MRKPERELYDYLKLTYKDPPPTPARGCGKSMFCTFKLFEWMYAQEVMRYLKHGGRMTIDKFQKNIQVILSEIQAIYQGE